ncbi:MAG: oligosaccharide flippase family protein [Prevotella sp.]|nr:oligosaccharide flippase family protein [Bacteroidaceae bacterium]MBO5314738.1 oligosaccharide flippase family protein [Prevotella sp.]
MKRFFKDFFIYGFASILGKVVAVFLMPIYTNILTKEEYGAMALITACQGVIGLVSNLNIHSGIARDYHEKGINRTQLVSTGIWSILGISSTILVVMLMTSKFWLTNVLGLDSIYIIPFTLMLFTIPAASLLSYFAILTRFKKKPILYSIGTIIQLLVQLTVSITGVVFLRLGILSIFAGTLCGELFGILYYSYINRINIAFTFNREYLKRALLFSIPTLPAILAGWIDSSMGQIIIGKYISTAELGVYSIALQLSSVFAFISIGLNNVWQPYLYENYQKEGFLKDINKLYTAIVLILTIISVSVSLMSKEIVLLLSNSSYLEASKYFTLLCIPMCVYLLFPVATSGISISRDTKYISISYIVGSVINIVFLFIMIKSIGIYSVPIALGLSRIATYSISYYVSKKKGIIVLPNGVLVLLIASILACFFITKSNLGTIYRAAIAVLVCGIIAAYIVKSINPKHFITARKKKVST